MISEYSAELRFCFVDRPDDNAKDHVTQLVREFIAKLRAAGCMDVDFTLVPRQREDVEVQNAPEGYIFKKLEP